MKINTESRNGIRSGGMNSVLNLGKLTVAVVRGVVLLTLGMGLTSCAYTWHQKVTVEVEVDGQTYANSSVVGMSVTRHPDFLPIEGSYDTELRGEAVVVNLPEHRYLFALLKGQEFIARKVFHDKLAGTISGDGWLEILSNLRETREITRKDFPLLVTFTDNSDPKSVQKVDPDNLASTFGPEVDLKRITLEITDEDVTEGKIEKVLGWLCTFSRNGARLNGSTSVAIMDNKLSNNLGPGYFKTEKCQ